MNVITPSPEIDNDPLERKANDAINASRLTRHLIESMWTAYGVMIVAYFFFGGFLGRLISVVGFSFAFGTFAVNGVCLTFWWIRYHDVVSADVDFIQAKRNWAVSLGLWMLMMALIILPIGLAISFPR